jgi:hypothetical protein
LKGQQIRWLVHKIETIFKFENAKNGLDDSEDNFEANIDSTPQFSLNGQYEEGDFLVLKKGGEGDGRGSEGSLRVVMGREGQTRRVEQRRALEVMIN